MSIQLRKPRSRMHQTLDIETTFLYGNHDGHFVARTTLKIPIQWAKATGVFPNT